MKLRPRPRPIIESRDPSPLQIRVDKGGKIVDAKFKTFGCGSAIASSSLITEWVKGKNVSFRNGERERVCV